MFGKAGRGLPTLRLLTPHALPTPLEARLLGLIEAVEHLVGSSSQVLEAEHRRASTRLASATVEAGRGRGTDAVDRATRQAAEKLGSVDASLVDRLAPGMASSAPDDLGGGSREFIGAGVSSYVRVGVLAGFETVPMPVLVPVLGIDGWRVRADPVVAHRLLQSVALRLLASTEPFRLRMDAFDPRLTGAMGLLGPVTARYPQIVPRAAHTTADLRLTLTDLVEVSAARANRMAQLGYDRFEDLTRNARAAPDAYRVVILFDYPAGVDERAQHDLVRLARTASHRGLCFLIHHDPKVEPERGVDPAELLDLLDSVTVVGEEIEMSRLPEVRARIDPAFDATVAARACDVVLGLADRAALPTINFYETLPDGDEWWRPVQDELTAVIGYADRTPATVRLRSGNPALPHVLVGGAVGQGKSNLLLVLIHGLAVGYSPADLQMYLLDFKHGVEFSALGPAPDRDYWLPHIRVLGVHSDQAFGLAVLRHLSDELVRRSKIFKACGNVTDISQLPPGPARPPRILVVLDEFQVLLEEDDKIAAEAAKLLERLVRTGRAYGVHIVLATQTIEGLQRLATRRDAVFGQVPYRIALKTTRADSQSILSTGNAAAADLRFRGEAILNSNFGSPDDNQQILVSYADRDALDDLRRQLWARAQADGGAPVPRIFHQDEPAQLAVTSLIHPAPTDRSGAGSDRAWAGLPIAVSEAPVEVDLAARPGSGALVLGDGAADALGVLSGLAISLALNARTPPRFVILDATAPESSLSRSKAALVRALAGLGCDVEAIDQLGALTERLFAVRDAIKAGAIPGPTYLLGVGLHAIPRMTAHVDGRFESPADALQQIVREGPSVGVVTLAWWNRLHVCDQHLGFGRADVATHLFLRHPVDGVRSVCGPLVEWKSEPHRGLLWDGLGTGPTTVVPFAPLTLADADRLIAKVAR
jgi:DNA segregation ATPase FtsK/SpoIIIE, S-DNA-T family